MNKLIWFTTIVIFIFVFVIPGILATGIKMIPKDDQPGYDFNKRLSIYGTREVSQNIVSTDDNFVAIGTSIRNPNLKNKKEVILRLFDEKENLVRISVISGQNIEDGDFIKFIFEPIRDSLNKSYSFILSSPEAGPEETIEVFYIESPTDQIISYSYDQNSYSGGVPLVIFHKPNGRIEVIKEVYFNWLSRLLPLRSQKI